jgi:hypothetical protein
VTWDILYTDEFAEWWDRLTIAEQESVSFGVGLLKEHGPLLQRPHADVIQGSAHRNMKELRCQHHGRPYRVLFIFDPRRNAVLLIGGDKTGNDRWYEENVPRADAIYLAYLSETGQGDQ